MNFTLPDTVIDRDELLERIDQDWELLEELVEMFSEEADAMVGDIEQAIYSSDAPSLFRAAHSMKSAVGNFAAKRVQQLALELEMMGRNEQMENAAEYIPQLKLEMASAKVALKTMLDEGNA